MSFGEQNDEFLSIELKELIINKEKILNYNFVTDLVPVLSNYELKAGFVFKLAIVPLAYDVSIGELYDDAQSNKFQLRDHLEIDFSTLTGNEQLFFNISDYKRVRGAIDGNNL